MGKRSQGGEAEYKLSLHGYAKWQNIIEDKDVGLSEIARQELNLPVFNGPAVGGNNTTISSNSGYTTNVKGWQLGAQSIPVEGPRKGPTTRVK
ncbi:hypothetical protein KSP40_PGU009485 [Platanthera guangdongensis]|uniref:Uncharacterized protein n=1 Tax=Platanthera guangdongensis TaxID=2320717 RepID=A0ABR2LDK8_9ASPA